MNPNSQRQPRALVSLSLFSQLGVGNGQPLTLTSSLSRARRRNPLTLTSSLPSLSVRHSQSLGISPRHALVLSLFSFAVNFLRATRFVSLSQTLTNPSPLKHSQIPAQSPPPSPGFSGRQRHRRRLHSQRPRGPRVVSATAVAWSSAPPLRLRWPLPSSSLRQHPGTRQNCVVLNGCQCNENLGSTANSGNFDFCSISSVFNLVFCTFAALGHVAVMYLSRTFGRTLFAAAARSRTYASSAGTATAAGDKTRNPLEEFFEVDRDMESDKPIVYGRGWKASELRLKSWDDLHKLWYVLLKEKNMLMTQRQMLNSQNLRFPNPERIPKVRKSMCRIKQVLTERAIDEPDPRRSAEMKRMINAL
ncbi:39S ribosomal protein [Arachis hypogaea]|nr:39S ribosomal protein [Arachis hypogaea]